MVLVRRSELIWREQLFHLSGGEGGRNVLNLATPILYCGGAAFATKNGLVAHITFKEKCNPPLPSDTSEELVLWRIGTPPFSGDKPWPRDVACLAKKKENSQDDYVHDKGIPFFWEPMNQKKKESKVQYYGHWKLKSVEEVNERIMKDNRCAKMTFEFERYDETFDRIIRQACTVFPAKDVAKIDFGSEKEIDLTSRSTASSPAGASSKGKRRSPSAKQGSDDVSNTVDARKKQSPTKSPQNQESGSGKTTNSQVYDKKRKLEATIEASRMKQSPKKLSPTKATTSVEPLGSVPVASLRAPLSSATTAPNDKPLEHYTAYEVRKLVEKKGYIFQNLGKELHEADFSGRRIIEQLERGDDHFDEFLDKYCSTKLTPLQRLSLLGTLKDVMEVPSL